jgi:hypothetical protein
MTVVEKARLRAGKMEGVRIKLEFRNEEDSVGS